jgi:aryl-alcohol dehydrogenase-like predicted oxidoreductase
MRSTKLADELQFVIAQSGQDEATVLARAVQAGMRILFREALVEGFLTGRVPREEALAALGPQELNAIELQRDALKRDVEWGLRIG